MALLLGGCAVWGVAGAGWGLGLGLGSAAKGAAGWLPVTRLGVPADVAAAA
ncbi:hypothetical protein AB4039_11755 [Streptomyces sp. M-16]|uniref:hypothetical protein n=1 Tax=Streptomyces sp. M-16 TaxID=3233040 RepID=UPI003F9E7E8A